MTKLLQIGELAKHCGVSTDTLRFYEKSGLLAPSARSEGGYRLYADEAISQVMFILRGKEMGLSLDEIHELSDIREEATLHTCAEVKGITQRRLNEVSEKIAALERVKHALTRLNAACCGMDDDDATHCSILETLAESEDSNSCS
ncbi:zinc-responsive transcriptional regulator [Salinivibrio sp. PR6]|nr:Zn(2+)-responsive transcriptional regulator [Salinivibrio sp. PR6]OOE80293.1 zinc-responsive transcriptional regulator [Salinivibrio sp. PR6]